MTINNNDKYDMNAMNEFFFAKPAPISTFIPFDPFQVDLSQAVCEAFSLDFINQDMIEELSCSSSEDGFFSSSSPVSSMASFTPAMTPALSCLSPKLAGFDFPLKSSSPSLVETQKPTARKRKATADSDEPSTLDKRERNRLAAERCRRRKVETIETLMAKVNELTEINSSLMNEKNKLADRVLFLEQLINAKRGLSETTMLWFFVLLAFHCVVLNAEIVSERLQKASCFKSEQRVDSCYQEIIDAVGSTSPEYWKLENNAAEMTTYLLKVREEVKERASLQQFGDLVTCLVWKGYSSSTITAVPSALFIERNLDDIVEMSFDLSVRCDYGLRTVANTLADAVIENMKSENGDGIEGLPPSKAIQFLIMSLRDLLATNPQFSDDLKPLLEKLSVTLKIASLPFITSHSYYEDVDNEPHQFKSFMFLLEFIVHSLKVNEDVILPFGYTTFSAGHAMVLKIQRKDADHFDIFVYNTGAGTQYHASRISGNWKFNPWIRFENVPAALLDKQVFFRKYYESQFSPTLMSASPLQIYESVLGIHTIFSHYARFDFDEVYAQEGQLSGTCTIRSFQALLHHSIGPKYIVLEIYWNLNVIEKAIQANDMSLKSWKIVIAEGRRLMAKNLESHKNRLETDEFIRIGKRILEIQQQINAVEMADEFELQDEFETVSFSPLISELYESSKRDLESSSTFNNILPSTPVFDGNVHEYFATLAKFLDTASPFLYRTIIHEIIAIPFDKYKVNVEEWESLVVSIDRVAKWISRNSFSADQYHATDALVLIKLLALSWSLLQVEEEKRALKVRLSNLPFGSSLMDSLLASEGFLIYDPAVYNDWIKTKDYISLFDKGENNSFLFPPDSEFSSFYGRIKWDKEALSSTLFAYYIQLYDAVDESVKYEILKEYEGKVAGCQKCDDKSKQLFICYHFFISSNEQREQSKTSSLIRNLLFYLMIGHSSPTYPTLSFPQPHEFIASFWRYDCTFSAKLNGIKDYSLNEHKRLTSGSLITSTTVLRLSEAESWNNMQRNQLGPDDGEEEKCIFYDYIAFLLKAKSTASFMNLFLMQRAGIEYEEGRSHLSAFVFQMKALKKLSHLQILPRLAIQALFDSCEKQLNSRMIQLFDNAEEEKPVLFLLQSKMTLINAGLIQYKNLFRDTLKSFVKEPLQNLNSPETLVLLCNLVIQSYSESEFDSDLIFFMMKRLKFEWDSYDHPKAYLMELGNTVMVQHRDQINQYISSNLNQIAKQLSVLFQLHFEKASYSYPFVMLSSDRQGFPVYQFNPFQGQIFVQGTLFLNAEKTFRAADVKGIFKHIKFDSIIRPAENEPKFLLTLNGLTITFDFSNSFDPLAYVVTESEVQYVVQKMDSFPYKFPHNFPFGIALCSPHKLLVYNQKLELKYSFYNDRVDHNGSFNLLHAEEELKKKFQFFEKSSSIQVERSLNGALHLRFVRLISNENLLQFESDPSGMYHLSHRPSLVIDSDQNFEDVGKNHPFLVLLDLNNGSRYAVAISPLKQKGFRGAFYSYELIPFMDNFAKIRIAEAVSYEKELYLGDNGHLILAAYRMLIMENPEKSFKYLKNLQFFEPLNEENQKILCALIGAMDANLKRKYAEAIAIVVTASFFALEHFRLFPVASDILRSVLLKDGTLFNLMSYYRFMSQLPHYMQVLQSNADSKSSLFVWADELFMFDLLKKSKFRSHLDLRKSFIESEGSRICSGPIDHFQVPVEVEFNIAEYFSPSWILLTRDPQVIYSILNSNLLYFPRQGIKEYCKDLLFFALYGNDNEKRIVAEIANSMMFSGESDLFQIAPLLSSQYLRSKVRNNRLLEELNEIAVMMIHQNFKVDFSKCSGLSSNFMRNYATANSFEFPVFKKISKQKTFRLSFESKNFLSLSEHESIRKILTCVSIDEKIQDSIDKLDLDDEEFKEPSQLNRVENLKKNIMEIRATDKEITIDKSCLQENYPRIIQDLEEETKFYQKSIDELFNSSSTMQGLSMMLGNLNGKQKAPSTDELGQLFGNRDYLLYSERFPYLSKEQIVALHSNIGNLLCALTKVQHFGRIEKSISNCLDDSRCDKGERKDRYETLLNECKSQRMFDPIRFPYLLVFEFFENLSVRSLHLKYISKLLTFDKDKFHQNYSFQLGMGSGKTFLIGPVLAHEKSFGNERDILNVIMPPASLFPDNSREIATRTRKLFGQSSLIFTLPPHKSEDYFLEACYRKLKAVMRRNEFVLASPHELQSLQNSYIKELYTLNDAALSSDCTKAQLLEDILLLFRTSGERVCDELEMSSDPFSEYNFPLPEKSTLNEIAVEFIAIIWRVLLEDPYFRKQKLNLRQNNQEYFKDSRSMAFRTFLYNQISSRLSLQFEDESMEMIKQLLTLDDIEGSKEMKELKVWFHERSIKLGTYKSNALILLRLFIVTWLPEILSQSVNKNFGFSLKNQSKLTAIPYVANNVPKEGSEFSLLWDTLSKSILTYIVSGLTDENAKRYLKDLKREASTERAASPDVALSELQTNKKFIQAFGVSIFSLSEKDYKVFQRKLMLDDPLIHDFLFGFMEKYVFPSLQSDKFLVVNNFQISSLLFKTDQGYSGTLGNKFIFTHKTLYNSLSYDLDEHFDSQVVHSILKRGKVVNYANDNGSSIESFMEFLLKVDDNAHAIIDVGSHFKGTTNYKVACAISSALLNLKSKIDTVLFYDDDSKKLAFIKTGKEEEKRIFSSNDKATIFMEANTSLETLFVYYDEWHIFGANVPHEIDAAAYVIMGADTRFEPLLQCCMRMRRLLSSQRLFLITSDTLNDYVGTPNPSINDFIKLSLKNSFKNEKLQNEILVVQKMLAAIADQLFILMHQKTADINGRSQIVDAFKWVFIRDMTEHFAEDFLKGTIITTSLQVIASQKAFFLQKITASIESLSGKFDFDGFLPSMQLVMDEIISTYPCPNEIMEAVNCPLDASINSINDQFQEMETQMQVQMEQKMLSINEENGFKIDFASITYSDYDSFFPSPKLENRTSFTRSIQLKSLLFSTNLTDVFDEHVGITNNSFIHFYGRILEVLNPLYRHGVALMITKKENDPQLYYTIISATDVRWLLQMKEQRDQRKKIPNIIYVIEPISGIGFSVFDDGPLPDFERKDIVQILWYMGYCNIFNDSYWRDDALRWLKEGNSASKKEFFIKHRLPACSISLQREITNILNNETVQAE